MQAKLRIRHRLRRLHERVQATNLRIHSDYLHCEPDRPAKGSEPIRTAIDKNCLFVAQLEILSLLQLVLIDRLAATCTITVEVSGPNQPSVWSIAPDDLRRMVGFILTQCVALRRTGGFITRDFEKMLLFLVDTPTLGGTTINPIVQTNRVYRMSFYTKVQNKLVLTSYSKATSSAFLTAKISGPNVPGRVDPSIFVAVSLWSYAAHRMGSTSGVTDLEHRLKTWLNLIIAKEFATKALAQSAADSTTTWAPSTLVPDEMTYDCDANLGAPSAANCSNINYSQLGAPSTKIMIGPGTPKVLSLDECNVVISAGTNIVITWDQIRLALEGLLLFCVSRPWQSSIGGRAYYNPEPQFAAPSSFKRAAAELSGMLILAI